MQTARRWIASLGLVLAVGLASSPAAAVPPVSFRGLGVPTALSFYDRARQVAQAVRRIAPADDGAEKSDAEPAELRSVDTLVLDPGHGDDNTGAIGITGIAEKYLTLELAYTLRERLQRRFPELRVVMTRYWDRSVGLKERVHLANRIDADLFMSLHYNAASHQRAVGLETYFLETRKTIPGEQPETGKPIASTTSRITGIHPPPDAETFGIQGDSLPVIRRDLRRARNHRWSGWFAEAVQRQLVSHVETSDRGVKQANFAVLRGAMMPAVVVEAGFMTHPEEGRRILRADHRRKLAEALVDAVLRFDRKRARTD